MRNHGEHMQHAAKAERTGKPEFGVKGKSILHSLPGFDTIVNCPVDYMHCVLLGVVRRLLSLWFKSTYHKEEWYIGTKITDVNKRLLSIKPPHSITRAPRSVERGSNWKASECRAFLLYYLPIVLHGILPDKFLLHAMVLSKAIRIMLGETTADTLQVSEQLLRLFWRLTEKYYGLQHCTMNIHLLSHLPLYVKHYGPLWTHSAFAFEDGIGHLVKKAHGTHNIGHQIVTSYLLQWRMSERRSTVIEKNSCPVELRDFTSRFTMRKSSSNLTQLSESVQAIGKCSSDFLDSKTTDALESMCQTLNIGYRCPVGTVITVFSKVIINGTLVYSKSAKRVKRYNSFTVTYIDPQEPQHLSFGIVERFIICPACDSVSMNVAVITPLTVCTSPLFDKSVYPPELQCLHELLTADIVAVNCAREKDSIVVPIEYVRNLCFNVSTLNFSGLTTLVNERLS